MTLRIDPAALVFAEFGGLEPPLPGWQAERPYWEDYNQKFFRSCGAEYRPQDSNVEQWLAAPDRASFAAMAGALLPVLAERADLSAVDFVLLAHWLPDLHLGTSVTNFALHRLGLRDGFGFAVSDQGRAASLFALHCMESFLAHGQRALLMVMDQKHLLYRSRIVEHLKPVNCASLLAVEQDGPQGLVFAGYERCAEVDARTLGPALRELWDRFGLGPAATLIADPGLAEAAGFTGPMLDQRPELACSAPFAAIANYAGPDTDFLAVVWEEQCLSAICLKRDGVA